MALGWLLSKAGAGGVMGSRFVIFKVNLSKHGQILLLTRSHEVPSGLARGACVGCSPCVQATVDR